MSGFPQLYPNIIALQSATHGAFANQLENAVADKVYRLGLFLI